VTPNLCLNISDILVYDKTLTFRCQGFVNHIYDRVIKFQFPHVYSFDYTTGTLHPRSRKEFKGPRKGEKPQDFCNKFRIPIYGDEYEDDNDDEQDDEEDQNEDQRHQEQHRQQDVHMPDMGQRGGAQRSRGRGRGGKRGKGRPKRGKSCKGRRKRGAYGGW